MPHAVGSNRCRRVVVGPSKLLSGITPSYLRAGRPGSGSPVAGSEPLLWVGLLDSLASCSCLSTSHLRRLSFGYLSVRRFADLSQQNRQSSCSCLPVGD